MMENKLHGHLFVFIFVHRTRNETVFNGRILNVIYLLFIFDSIE